MYQIYQVQSFDTLDSIANMFNTTVDELIKINGITKYTPIMNSPIIVPTFKDNNYDTYIVKQGDNLYAIASKYNTTPKVIALINGLKENEYIYPNQELKVPKNNLNIYAVTQTEKVTDVLNKTNMNFDELIKLNPNMMLEEDQIIFYKREN